MPRMEKTKRAELEAFWRAHLEDWAASNLNQREYCEAHGLPLKRFGNWRAKFKHDAPAPARKLLYRRGGSLSPSASPRTREIPAPAGYIPTGKTSGQVGRRDYSKAGKRRIVEEACREGASVSGIARKYGISTSVLFRWRKAFGMDTASRIVPVTITEAPDNVPDCLADLPAMLAQETPPAGPMFVEQSTSGIEVELVGGRRVRFERDADPETVHRLVALLEGDVPC